MNLSRLATLAVFFMMVMSAFVTVPTYNVGADEHEEGGDDDGGDDHDHGDDEGHGDECPFDADNPDSPCNAEECRDHDSAECEDFVGNYCENNDDPQCAVWAADYVCYNMDTHEVEWDYATEEECADAGLMWVSTNSGPDNGRDDGDVAPTAAHATMTMESLEDWRVDFHLEMPIDWSNEARNEISNMCEMMLGTPPGEINQECFDVFIEAEMSGDDHGEHDHDDEFRCPPEMDDATCETLMGCDEGDADMLSCMEIMYNYCYNNADSEMCEDMMNGHDDDHHDDEPGLHHHGDEDYHHDHYGDDDHTHEESDRHHDHDDDGGQFIWGIIGYEAGHIDATTLMEEYIIPEFGDDFMDVGDDGDHGRPVLYDVQTFDVDSDGELRIYQNFLYDVKTTPDFVCGNGEEISFQAVNDGNGDCEDGADEQWYDNNTPDDTSDDCQEWNDETCEGEEVNWFDCHDGSEVWINQVNNWEWNCEDGEDEYQEHHDYWWGDVYLFEGDHSEGLIEGSENVAFGESYCYWSDDNQTYVNCDDFMVAEISAGTWSLVTTGSCHEEWDEVEGDWRMVGYDCHGENGNDTNMGPYSHKLAFDYGEDEDIEDTRWAMNGSIHHESMEMEKFPHFDTYNDDKEEFVMYQSQVIELDTDSTVRIVSAGWQCNDWDEDGVDDDCWGQSPGLYIYNGDDGLMEDLIASNQHYHSDDMFCPVESEDEDHSNCGYALLEVDLDAGAYTIYTTFNHVNQASYYNNIEGAYVVNGDEESDEWDGYMRDNYWEWDEEAEEEVLVEGTASRDYFPQADYHEYEPECYDEETGEEIDCDDLFSIFVPIFMISENVTHYEDGNLTAEEAADNVVDLFYVLVEMGIFEEDDHEGHGEEGVYWIEWSYCEWEGNDYDGDTRWYCTDEGEGSAFDDWWYYCEVYTDDDGNERWVCTDDFGQSPAYESSAGNTYYKDGGRPNDIDGDGTGDECPFDMDNPESPCHVEACSSGPDNPDCQNYVTEYCDNVDDDGCDVMFRMVCYDSENHEVIYEIMSPDDCENAGFMWIPVADDDHDDDNPALLDGIIGVSDPQDTDPIPMPENMVGALSDNEDKPMLSGTSFKLHFDGVDESLDVHSAYIPIGDDGITWHVEMILLEDYEVKSCEGCEDLVIDGSNARFSADEPVTLAFGKAQDTSECDAIVTIGEGGYSFEPAEITISEGDTVCWIWKDTADVHNVAEIATKFDADMNLEDAKIGFYSGESATTVDFRHTFTENDKTHYYVCEPHATMGMVGTVTVGNGTEADPIQAIADESGLPSISFAVGALVLVGAAGLRRRIH